MFRSFARLLPFLLAAISMLSFAGRASAQVAQHFATGAAQFAANQSDFTGSGHATHLGKYTEVGQVTFAGTGTPNVLAVDGWTHYFAANGDRLDAWVTGTVNQTTGVILATATYNGGTGRFVHASGASVLTGQMLGGGALVISAVGSISF